VSQRIDSVSTICRFRITGANFLLVRDPSHEAVTEFVEATTGTDDKRPAFQQMIEWSCGGDNRHRHAQL
jgi:hypothetical protein